MFRFSAHVIVQKLKNTSELLFSFLYFVESGNIFYQKNMDTSPTKAAQVYSGPSQRIVTTRLNLSLAFEHHAPSWI